VTFIDDPEPAEGSAGRGPGGADRTHGGSERGRRRRDETAYELLQRGRDLLANGHPHGAAVLLSRAKLLEPDKASIREALGRALYLAGRNANARREFAKVVQIDPVNDYAHFGLALSCAKTGQRARAIGHLKLAIAMRPGNDAYRDALARLIA
jgi:Flp pilus assembly protein TadD